MAESFFAGAKLKETGITHWTSPNEGATNEFGFTALPGGARNPNGPFDFLGSYAHWWSVDQKTSDQAWLRYIPADWIDFQRIPADKKYGLSVRCLKDMESPNFVEINGTRYDLPNGFLAYYGNFEGHGVYNHQITLYGPEIEINWADYTVKGIGPVIDFEIFNTQTFVENGSYTFSTPEIAETVKVYENFDVSGDGLINDLDYYTTLQEGKYYISSRISYYGKAIDLNDYYSEPSLFKSGNATMVISEGKYSITFNCKGENGDQINGHYEGELKYVDFSEE